MTPPREMLKEHDLRSTPGRQAILNLFLKKKHALSHGDIERWLDPEYDRVTVYRTLRIFLKRGILHKVLMTKERLNTPCAAMRARHRTIATTTCILNAGGAVKPVALRLRYPLSNCQRDTRPANATCWYAVYAVSVLKILGLMVSSCANSLSTATALHT